MRALTVTNRGVTREVLLGMARKVPGAWIGLRIAGMLLVLEGWRSTEVARLFDVARWSVVKWIRRVNEEGASALEDRKRSGRPCRLSLEIQRDLEKALQNDPNQFGLQRNRWDGIGVVEYLRRVHGVRLKVRQAQRWIRRLGFSLRRPIYRYVQATSEGVEEFRQTIKKTFGGETKQGKADGPVFG
jgi:transposase